MWNPPQHHGAPHALGAEWRVAAGMWGRGMGGTGGGLGAPPHCCGVGGVWVVLKIGRGGGGKVPELPAAIHSPWMEKDSNGGREGRCDGDHHGVLWGRHWGGLWGSEGGPWGRLWGRLRITAMEQHCPAYGAGEPPVPPTALNTAPRPAPHILHRSPMPRPTARAPAPSQCLIAPSSSSSHLQLLGIQASASAPSSPPGSCPPAHWAVLVLILQSWASAPCPLLSLILRSSSSRPNPCP